MSAHQRLITGDDGGGQRIFDLLFDQAAQIAGAVLDRVGLLGEQAEQAVVPRQADILVGQRGAQLTEHDLSNMAEVILGQLVERDNLVNAVEKLRTHDFFKSLHHAVLAHLRHGAAEACRRVIGLRTGVRGHNDDRVLEADNAALRVGQTAVIQNLQQRIEHIRVRLLDLVEQNDRVRTAADLLGQLTGFIVADVSRRGTDQAGNCVLFHIFGHIETHECIRRVEQVESKLLDQLGLADAGRTDEQEGCRLALGADARAAAADGRADRVYGFVLTDNVRFQAGFHIAQACRLLCRYLGCRNAGPDFDHLSQKLFVNLRCRLGQQLVQLCLHLQNAAAAGGDLGVGLLLLGAGRGLGQLVKLCLQALKLVLQLGNLGQLRRIQIEPRAGFVDQVDGLIWQKTVGDIAFAHLSGTAAHLIGNSNAVEGLVVRADALQNLGGLGNRRLTDIDRLETALERGVLLDILAVLLERGRADHLNVSAGKGRLENVCGIHRAFGIAGADNVVHLIDDKDDVADTLYFVDQALHAALKLAAELRARHESGQIEQMDLLVAHLERNAALVDADCQTLGNGRLADTGFANQARVVLLAAVQNLNDAVGLAVAAHDVVNAAFCGLLGQVFAVIVQIFALFVLLAGRTGAGLLLRAACGLPRQSAGSDRVGLVGCVVVRAVRTGGNQVVQVGQGADLTGERFEVVLGDTHLLHDVVERLDTQFACALEAQTLLGGLIRSLDFGDEHHRDVFLAPRAHWHIHRLNSFREWKIENGELRCSPLNGDR